MNIKKICKKYNITNYTINDDGSIDVEGDVNLSSLYLDELPLTFNKVTGYFGCGDNKLTTLKGSPRWVGGNFSCNLNNLTNLEFSPEYVGAWFSCGYNKLTTLKGCPTWVGGYFECVCNNLTNLEFSPEYVGSWFDCQFNKLIDNYCDTQINEVFYTNKIQDGLVYDYDNFIAINYIEWIKLRKRKLVLEKLFN